MPYCRECGKEVSTFMAFCRNCGVKLNIPQAIGEKDDKGTKSPAINSSGNGASSEIPPEIKGWNWGAFFLWWIWGIGNNTYISLLTLIPYVGQIVMPFVLGAKGNEWAWKNKRWDSIQHFKSVQWKWESAGIIWFVIAVIIGILVAVLS